jgi:hypothetical protein
VITSLFNTNMPIDEVTEAEKPHLMAFSAEGKEAWVAWFDRHGEEAEAPDFPDQHSGTWSKMRAHAARFALILARLRQASEPHPTIAVAGQGDPWESRGTIDYPPVPAGPIEAEDVRGAVRLADYFKNHFDRAEHKASDGLTDSGAKAVLVWLRRHRPTEFCEADINKHLRVFRKDPQSLAEALTSLTNIGVIRPASIPDESNKRGPKSSRSYEVHPELYGADEAAEKGISGINGIIRRCDSEESEPYPNNSATDEGNEETWVA